MDFHKGKDIEKLTEDDIRDFLKYLVEKCRTAELGAHEDICDHCGHKKIRNITRTSK